MGTEDGYSRKLRRLVNYFSKIALVKAMILPQNSEGTYELHSTSPLVKESISFELILRGDPKSTRISSQMQ